MSMRSLPLVLLAAACATPRTTLVLDWPVPAGWKHETLAFPLDFAPELPYRGVEELRFMPGFFKSEESSFWSYDFAWWLDEAPAFDARTLAPQLVEYFRGLALAVGKDKYVFDPAQFRAELAARGSDLVGQVHSYDPFTTGKPIVLNVEASLQRWPGSAQCAVVFRISPRPFGDPVWTELRACAASLRAIPAQH